MWVFEILKSIWASYKAGRAAKAAIDLPKGQEAVDAIAKDGDAIAAELAKGSVKP